MRRAELTLGLITKPRSLVISSPTHALILRPFQHPSSSSKQLIVEFTQINNQSIDTGIKLAPCWGCLGILEIEHELFIVIVTHATPIGILHPGHQQIHRVVSVELFCLTSSLFDFQHATTTNLTSTTTTTTSSSTISSSDLDESSAGYLALNGIKKILSNGQFYFSTTTTDLSSRTEHRVVSAAENRLDDDSARRFSWNSFMLFGLSAFQHALPAESRLLFDNQNFLVSVIQGYVATYDLKLPPSTSPSHDNTTTTTPLSNQPASNEPISLSISLFSRLGSRRAGTRFNTRGIDDDGNVANFVESETLIVSGSHLFSFVQLRGSVPLFFEQSGTGMTNVIGGLSGQGYRTQLTRTGIATQPAFERHFEDLLQQYSCVHIINLLSKSRDAECTLSQAYQQRLQAFAREDQVHMAHFDLHQRAKTSGLDGVRLQLANDPMIGGQIEQMGAFWATLPSSEGGEGPIQVMTHQTGVFRVNCLDCLDRTNVVQEMVSRMAVEIFLSAVHPHLLRSDYLWNCHRSLWADNGDVLSKIYAGTGALNTSFTRGGKQTFSGILSNASKSVGRLYTSNFIDKSKQAYIDLMLGNLSGQKPVKVFDPLNDTVKRMLHDRRLDYSQTIPISLWVGTYNLNGRAPPMANNDELMAWLCPTPYFEPDLLAVSFQEIVKLSPQQIMITDPEKKRRWERVILSSLENRPNKKASYAIIRSDQLVGAALIILAKTDLVPAVRAVEAKTKKTGLKGIAGNKGAVAIRLDIHDSSFCFVTAHFAAGMSNLEERNHDFHTIEEDLKFLKGKTIAGHENVIWAGDFNYRIDAGLHNTAVRQAVADRNYHPLLAADQLLEQMSAHNVFNNYSEGPITFPPTYKYDVGSDRYDTSEKMRIPAWTDRILYQGSDLKLKEYSRAELKASDHRPVYAILETHARMVDRAKKEVIRQEILESNEVGRLRDALLMPLEAGHSTTATVLDEWWKVTDHPNGMNEDNASHEAQEVGTSNNPFISSLNLARPTRQNSTPEATPAPVNHRFVNGKLNRQVSSSVPSSPPGVTSGKGNPPAIPARPVSRSPSETRKLAVTVDKANSTVVGKAPPPPPPPRPTSRSPAPKPTTTSVVELVNQQASTACTDSPRTRYLSGRKSAPSGLQLAPPSHPAVRNSMQYYSMGVKSPLLNASTSKLLVNSKQEGTPPSLWVELPPPRPVARTPPFSPSRASPSFKRPAPRNDTGLVTTETNPPLPPRPFSRLLTADDDEGAAIWGGLQPSEIDTLVPTSPSPPPPPPRPKSRIIKLDGKEIVVPVAAAATTPVAGVGPGPSLPARPASSCLVDNNNLMQLSAGSSGSRGLTAPSDPRAESEPDMVSPSHPTPTPVAPNSLSASPPPPVPPKPVSKPPKPPLKPKPTSLKPPPNL